MRFLILLVALVLLAAPAPAAGPASHSAALRRAHAPASSPVLFRSAYEKAVAAYCAARTGERAQRAYEIGWMLIRARQRDQAVPWLRQAARLGHGRAAPLLDALPQNRVHAAVPCRGPAALRLGAMPPIGAPAQMRAIARRIAPHYGLDPDLILAVIAVESGFQPDAVSPKNAQGLMQLTPDTAERFDVDDAFDPTENIRGGVRYLSWLLKIFDGDLALALAGYNAGENAVRRYGGIPPFPETQDYVRAVQDQYARLAGGGVTAERAPEAAGRAR